MPNEPKQVDTTEEIQIKKEPKEGFRSNNVNNEKNGSVKSDSVPSSPVDGRKCQKSPKLLSEGLCEEPKNNFGNKLWRMLFGNVIRSIDELYVHCEEEEDRSKCHDVVELLIRSRRDFNKLSNRLEEQSKFKLGQAMSWEIRKPTLHSPMNPGMSPGHANAAEEDKSRSFSPAQLDSTDQLTTSAVPQSEAPRQKPPSKLNPGAKPFSPVGVSGMQASAESKAQDQQQQLPPGLLPAPHAPTALSSTPSAMSNSGRTSAPTLVLPTRASSAGTAATAAALSSSTAHTTPPTQRSAEVHPRARAPIQPLLATKDDDWSDERLQREVQRASEQIWAEAEAWVEAEAVAEEQEWALLALGINSYLRDSDTLSDYEEDGITSAAAAIGLRSPLLSAHNSPKQFPVGMGLGLSVPGEAGAWEGNFVALSPEQRAIWEQTPPSRYGAGKTVGGSAALGRGHRSGSRSNLSTVGALAATGATPALTMALATPAITPVTSRHRADMGTAAGGTFFASISRSHSAGSGSPGSQVRAHSASSRSPSPTEAYLGSGTSAASGGRSLHDKLSSPDRRRTISPSEAQRRYEERHINAEINRDNTIAERVQKAHIASERRARLEQREAQRRARVLQALESKQKEVGERRSQFLRDIQVRANNETSKVQEVNFINALNSEAIAQRLEEVETRILAASVRRYS